MRLLLAVMSLLLALAFAHSASMPGKRYVSTPDVSWDEILPYIQSHVVPWLVDNEFQVYVCSEQVLRGVVTPYDDTLGSFAKVLLFEGLKNDSRIETALREATERFRAQLDTLDRSERATYRDVFWNKLVKREGFLPRLEAQFEKAKTKGRLRCSICESDPSFTAAGLQ